MTFTFGVFVSAATLVLEEIQLRRFPHPHELAVLGTVAVLENFGYRQLSNIWRIQGWWEFLSSKAGGGAVRPNTQLEF